MAGAFSEAFNCTSSEPRQPSGGRGACNSGCSRSKRSRRPLASSGERRSIVANSFAARRCACTGEGIPGHRLPARQSTASPVVAANPRPDGRAAVEAVDRPRAVCKRPPPFESSLARSRLVGAGFREPRSATPAKDPGRPHRPAPSDCPENASKNALIAGLRFRTLALAPSNPARSQGQHEHESPENVQFPNPRCTFTIPR